MKTLSVMTQKKNIAIYNVTTSDLNMNEQLPLKQTCILYPKKIASDSSMLTTAFRSNRNYLYLYMSGPMFGF